MDKRLRKISVNALTEASPRIKDETVSNGFGLTADIENINRLDELPEIATPYKFYLKSLSA